MILVSVEAENIGPFYPSDSIVFEPDITVITGQNDAGKSQLLKLIERILKNQPIDELDVAIPHRSPPTAPWEKDRRIKAYASFITEPFQGSMPVSAAYNMAPSCFQKSWSGEFKHNQSRVDSHYNHGSLQGWPNCIRIDSAVDDEIRTEIPLDEMNPTEAALLQIAFNNPIHAGEYTKLTSIHRRVVVDNAQQRLNDRLSKFLPSSLDYKFVLDPPSEAKPTIEIGLTDAHGGFTALGQRGSGIKKMISLLGRLALENVGKESTLLLLDEPETSLHADAQHALRYALEQLGKLRTIQVIMATHSPAMINPMRPETLRLLRREKHDEHAWTRFDNRPAGDNFISVRTSLGISPADSLLYSPITVLVEGPTEALCLPKLILRLSEAKNPDFSDAKALLGNATFISVSGDHFSSQCNLAKSFGVVPIVYADGDKSHDAPKQLKKHHSDVRIITPADPTHEIENLVPKATYFKALAKFLDEDEGAINIQAFDDWCTGAKLPEKMLFSKRVGRWIEDTFNPNFSGKPEIMLLACKEVAAEEIETESLARLMTAIREAAAEAMDPF